MARRRKPLPDSVAALDAYDRETSALSGMGSFALGAPVNSARADGAALTRAQRNALSARVRRAIGLHDKRGRPGGWGPSGYEMDTTLVGWIIARLASNPDLKVQTATAEVLLSLPHFIAKQWAESGHLADGTSTEGEQPKVLHPFDADEERIAGKVRDALVGDPSITDAKDRQRLVDAELERLRRNWKQLQQAGDNHA